MNIQRFTAPTSREALAKARQVFGEGTLILFNRPCEEGVEVVATGEDALQALDRNAAQQATPEKINRRSAAVPASYQEVASKVEDDANQLAMSTLSFQDYVRERMARKRHESVQSVATTTPQPAMTAQQQRSAEPQALSNAVDLILDKPGSSRKMLEPSAALSSAPLGIASELHAMKDLIEDRFNTLTWLGQARQNPIQANMMLKLIRAGYSPTLARTVLERMPQELDAPHAVRWIMDVLERNLKTDTAGTSIQEEGGIFALVGATGVGKTTTAAKLAGLCARIHGAASVGLITLDTYRVGAQEQLRAYGKMLGVVAHLAHDRAALQDLLGLLASKKMVLIDTTGLAPRDPRKREMMELLDLPKVKRLLVLNAGAHGDTMDDVVSAFKAPGVPQAIFSKIDEAVKLGPVIDAAIRHQLVVRGVTTGQRVPEDWESANAGKLVRASMRTAGASPFDPKISDLGFFFNQGANSAPAMGRLDA
jgi:flagellar biosynthesis protein FlhF